MSNLPLTYPDLVCDLDLDSFATETTSDFQNLVQDVTHILVELNGTNLDDSQKGVGIESYLSGTQLSFNGLIGVIEEQLSRDDRITGVIASIAQNTEETFTITIEISVSGTVLNLQYVWSAVGGLNFISGV